MVLPFGFYLPRFPFQLGLRRGVGLFVGDQGREIGLLDHRLHFVGTETEVACNRRQLVRRQFRYDRLDLLLDLAQLFVGRGRVAGPARPPSTVSAGPGSGWDLGLKMDFRSRAGPLGAVAAAGLCRLASPLAGSG